MKKIKPDLMDLSELERCPDVRGVKRWKLITFTVQRLLDEMGQMNQQALQSTELSK